MLEEVRATATKQGLALDTPEELWDRFVECTRQNLLVVLCLSPVGCAFQERLRQFPSLVNCCSINWCAITLISRDCRAERFRRRTASVCRQGSKRHLTAGSRHGLQRLWKLLPAST